MKLKKHIVFIIIFLLKVPAISWAQPPYAACFTVNADRGCAPFTVTVTSCSQSGSGVGQPDPRYYYDFVNSPTALTQNLTRTYNTPGIYVIRQAVNDGVITEVYAYDTIEVLGKPNPKFTVQVCENRLVRVNITDTNYDSFSIDYGDGTITPGVVGLNSYTYATTAARTISVTGQYSIACTGATATKNITPITSLTTPQIVDLTVTNQAASGSINLRFEGIVDRLYKIEYKTNNGAYVTYSNIIAASTGTITQSITGINTQSNTYTFRLQNVDSCMNTSANSAEIASIIINPSALNGSNQVNFLSNGGLIFNNFDLYRNTTLLQSSSSSPYNDNAVFCGTDYCYQIQGVLPTTNSSTGLNHRSYSASSCIKATYTGTAPVVTNINSTVEGDHVKVRWDQPAMNAAVPSVSFYTIYRKSGSSYNNYGSSNSESYTDNAVDVNALPYCYEVNYKDACNNVSAISINTCTVQLTVNRTDETNALTWTPYTGYYLTGIKEYVVENLDENGNVVLSKSVGLATSYTEIADPSLAQIIYRIKVVPNGTENLISYSNTVRLDLTPQIYMPNTFTPNGDGNNDVLEIKGKYFKSAKMTILNKWGEVVFISEDANIGWDGNYRGQPATVDSYGYHVVALDNRGKEISIKGVVSLLR